MDRQTRFRFGRARATAMLLAGLAALGGLSGCVMVGYSNRGGFFFWPGGLGIILVVLLVLWLLRRR